MFSVRGGLPYSSALTLLTLCDGLKKEKNLSNEVAALCDSQGNEEPQQMFGYTLEICSPADHQQWQPSATLLPGIFNHVNDSYVMMS